MKPTGLHLLFITAVVYCQQNILTEFSDLDKKITEMLDDPSAQDITEAVHFMNLYAVEMSNLSLKLNNDMAEESIDEMIKLYRQGRPKFVDIVLDYYEIKTHLHVEEETITRFRVTQSDARDMWDEFVTNLIKKSDKPI